MNNWKTLRKIALVSGILSLVFMPVAAVFNYEVNKMLYSGAPNSFIEYNLVAAMLPYLLAAIVSFVVAVFSSQASGSADIKETETKETQMQPKQEVDLEKAAQKKMETA